MSSTQKSVQRIADALESFRKQTWCSGTVEIVDEGLHLFYRDGRDSSRSHFIQLSSKATPKQLGKLSSNCNKATFDRDGEETPDEKCLRAGDLDCVMFSHKFNLETSGILGQVLPVLLKKESRRAVYAELYTLQVYGPGDFSRRHNYLPRNDSAFGSLVVVFPTPHVGGEVVLRDGESTFTLEPTLLSTENVPKIAYAAFPSHVEHEVRPVASGYRVALTYHLHHGKKAIPNVIPSDYNRNIETIARAIASLVDKENFMLDGGYLGFQLYHRYPIQTSSPATDFSTLVAKLKGVDRAVADACRALRLEISVNGIIRDPHLGEGFPHYLFLEEALDEFGEVYTRYGGSLYGNCRNVTVAHDYEHLEEVEEEVENSDHNLDKPVISYPVVWVTPLNGWEGDYKAKYTVVCGDESHMSTDYVQMRLMVSVPAWKKLDSSIVE